MHYQSIIKDLRSKTSEVILFHSGTGKDSIVLCDLLSKSFDRVVCVFMYIVKDLAYENRYINWALKTYPNIEFYKTPHFALYSFIKHGYKGIQKDIKIEAMTIAKIDRLVKVKFQIDWSVYGFKKNDAINRRLMLNGYKNGYCENTKKAYPLMDYKNSDCLNYISANNLIKPFNYGTLKPSSGCDISTPEFLIYLENKYPEDLQKVFETFPLCEADLFKYKTYGKSLENKAK
jgi:3'-phosphoadenosine 5'-phosphosulfate sulfotransferase (PAPS reductase)/FAD synthetase